MSGPVLVAVDGAAGSGKSTLARGLARALHVPYINTGLMYRAVAAASIGSRVDPDDAERLVDLARGLRFSVRGEDPPELQVEGYGPADLTTPDVESRVSLVSRHPGVRTVLRDLQRALGADGAVMEGRDIATVVFPDARLKLFLEADPDRRAGRRADERGTADDSVRTALHERDARDARTTPLEPAPGAVVIDTTKLSIEQTLDVALGSAREAWPSEIP
ncbi:MAG TPA: (d)CMP kinase [Actinomycetota bacterium]|nr:(d)CMP kinase [Actinomycetota bacterium]